MTTKRFHQVINPHQTIRYSMKLKNPSFPANFTEVEDWMLGTLAKHDVKHDGVQER